MSSIHLFRSTGETIGASEVGGGAALGLNLLSAPVVCATPWQRTPARAGGGAATGLAAWWAGKTFLCLESKICSESVGGFSSIEDGFPYSITVVILADFIGLPGPGLNLEPGFPWKGFTHAFLFSSVCRGKRRGAPWLVPAGTNCFPISPWRIPTRSWSFRN